MLEHFRFPHIFLRRCKNAYVSLITPELLQLVLENKPKIEYATLDTKLNRLGLPNRSKQLRKYYGTVLRDVLPTEAIDFLEGRVSSSVFARYYYKPFLTDVRSKAMKIVEPIQWELLYGLENHPESLEIEH
jgi:intergrase/recombinase